MPKDNPDTRFPIPNATKRHLHTPSSILLYGPRLGDAFQCDFSPPVLGMFSLLRFLYCKIPSMYWMSTATDVHPHRMIRNEKNNVFEYFKFKLYSACEVSDERGASKN